MSTAALTQNYRSRTHRSPPQYIPLIAEPRVQCCKYRVHIVLFQQSITRILSLTASTTRKIERAHIISRSDKELGDTEGFQFVRSQSMRVHDAATRVTIRQQKRFDVLSACVDHLEGRAGHLGMVEQVLLETVVTVVVLAVFSYLRCEVTSQRLQVTHLN